MKKKRTCSIYEEDAELLARIAGWNGVTVADVVLQLLECWKAKNVSQFSNLRQKGGVTTPPTGFDLVPRLDGLDKKKPRF